MALNKDHLHHAHCIVWIHFPGLATQSIFFTCHMDTKPHTWEFSLLFYYTNNAPTQLCYSQHYRRSAISAANRTAYNSAIKAILSGWWLVAVVNELHDALKFRMQPVDFLALTSSRYQNSRLFLQVIRSIFRNERYLFMKMKLVGKNKHTTVFNRKDV